MNDPTMRRLLVLLFCLSSAFGHPKIQRRILGGEDAAEGQFPYHASVRFYGFPACGGSIIGPNTVLISARCTLGQLSSLEGITVVVGSNKLNGGTTHNVTKIYTHPKYAPENSLEYGVAIIKVTPQFTYRSDSIQPINLASSSIGDNQVVFTAGYNANTPPSSTTLQFIKAKTLDFEECKEEMGELSKWIYNSSICMISGGYSGFCVGDWGSVLINEERDLVGVISFNDCPLFRHPDVYTNAVSHKVWIEEQLKL